MTRPVALFYKGHCFAVLNHDAIPAPARPTAFLVDALSPQRYARLTELAPSDDDLRELAAYLYDELAHYLAAFAEEAPPVEQDMVAYLRELAA